MKSLFYIPVIGIKTFVDLFFGRDSLGFVAPIVALVLTGVLLFFAYPINTGPLSDEQIRSIELAIEKRAEDLDNNDAIRSILNPVKDECKRDSELRKYSLLSGKFEVKAFCAAIGSIGATQEAGISSIFEGNLQSKPVRALLIMLGAFFTAALVFQICLLVPLMIRIAIFLMVFLPVTVLGLWFIVVMGDELGATTARVLAFFTFVIGLILGVLANILSEDLFKVIKSIRRLNDG